MSQEHTPNNRPPIPSQQELAKLPADGGPTFNRLVFEKSPYLLQHAANPVDWYPWGDAAFAKAIAENKPVFLSIGYATCHWCHVMEHESFEDSEVAHYLNQHYVAVKVDREERPDIDSIYMAACQAATGSGGWPLTAVLNHDRKPFFVGTYFPKLGRFGRPGMMDLLPQIAQLWTQQRADLEQSADRLTEHLTQIARIQPGAVPERSVVDQAYQQLLDRFDEEHGGFGDAPKFPTPHNLLFLLRYGTASENSKAIEMVSKTLSAMRAGGVYDHIGFGIHRYSTDRIWLLPHFEKMLYDQALVTLAFLEAYQVTGNPEFAETAREILTYVMRDMTATEGGYYSAEDADSEGVEGKFNVWTPAEVIAVLGQSDGAWFNTTFHITEGGNFAEQSTGHKTGDSIPHLQTTWDELAKTNQTTVAKLQQRVQQLREKLFAHREKRIHPLKDDKVLTDWNGLMIAAMARAGAVLGDASYTESARTAADFLWTKLRRDARLLKRYRLGEAGLTAHLEDYAFVIWGLIELHQSTFDVESLRRALELTEIVEQEFKDTEHGGYFQTSSQSEKLIVRQKEIYDGAIPSGNSVMAHNLLRLAHLTANTEFSDSAASIFKAFSNQVTRYPSGHSFLMMALEMATGTSREIVIVGAADHQATQALLQTVRSHYLPRTVILLKTGAQDEIQNLAGFLKEYGTVDGVPAAYVCFNFACQKPVTQAKELAQALTHRPLNQEPAP